MITEGINIESLFPGRNKGFDGDIREETERLRKENEKKIKALKEKLKKDEEEREKEKVRRNEEGQKKKKDEEQKGETEKEKGGEKKKEENEGKQEEKEKKEKDERKKAEEWNEKKEKYSKEFQKRPLNADKFDPKEYTSQMRDEDTAYLKEWIDFEIGRTGWLKDELGVERDRRYEAALTREEREKVRDWYYKNIEFLNKKLQKRWSEYHEARKRAVDMYNYKRDNKKEEEERKQRQEQEEEKKRKEEEKRKKEKAERKKKEEEKIKREEEEKRKKKPRQEKDRNKNKEEVIAIQELGITYPEYKAITGNIDLLSDTELAGLVKKVFKVGGIDKKEVKKGYYRCVKEWHPDINGSNGKKEICEIKIKVANNLYGEYNKRFGK